MCMHTQTVGFLQEHKKCRHWIKGHWWDEGLGGETKWGKLLKKNRIAIE